MKRIINYFVIFFVLFLGLQTTSEAATTYNGRLYEVWHPDSGFTVFAAESNGWMDYNSWMIKSTIDDRVYYCIDPALPLEGSEKGSHAYVYDYREMLDSSALTEKTYTKVNLLAYYGYGYKDNMVDHTNKKWYGITQVMIWRIMRPDLTWTFKATRNSTPDANLYKKEVKEMNDLLERHYLMPSFYPDTSKKLKLLLGQETTFKDTNEVISRYYEYNHNTILNLRIDNNNLIMRSDVLNKNTFSVLMIKSRTPDDYALFTSKNYQDIIVLGKPASSTLQISVEVTGGILNIQKVDGLTEKNKPQGEATLKGAIYEVFDKNKKSVGKITTDETGKGKISLENGSYTIKETKPPTGYKLSNKEYPFVISETNSIINIEVPNKAITGKLKITKEKGGSGEKFTSEKDATFEILNNKEEVIEELKTNEKGMAITSLPYGTYTVHQTNGEESYIYPKDTKIKMYEDKIYELDLQDLKLSKLEFTKLDATNNKPVSNVSIEIYKQIENETEKDELIYTGKTNLKGELQLENLKLGKYYIIEKEAPYKYKLNKEKEYFEVTENGKVIKITIKNKRKEGMLKFIKTNIKGNKKLSGAKIEIYLPETNKLIYRGFTNNKGEININNLVIGKYCLYEKEAPKGYKRYKGETCFRISKENQVVNIIMKNELKEKLSIPKTLKNNSYLITMISTILIITGTSYIIYNVKKKS